jgi:hypothetical protein
LATAYQQGFVDALRAVGIAFGVAAPTVPTPVRPSQGVQTIEADGRYTRWDQGGSGS